MDEQSQHLRMVEKRRVFYIPGYDPIHPRRYRELYRKESASQGHISGYDISIKAKLGEDGPYGWHVDATIDGRKVTSTVEVLVWSDIVRDSMSNTIPATYLQLLRTAWTYIGSGALRRLMWMRKGPVIAALYPVGMLLLQLLLAVLAGHLVGWGASYLFSLIPPIGDGIIARVQPIVQLAFYWSSMIAVMVAALRWLKSKDGKLYAYYLMHDYAYSARKGGESPPELEARMKEFANQIAAALADKSIDEVLVVGHSSGAHLAISILSDLIRQKRIKRIGPAVSFLSLGQVVPMVSFLPRAWRLRADLNYLSRRSELTWVDVSAPGDGCSFALCDPVSVTGVAPAGKRWPLILSAAFSQTLSPERWKKLRWRFFRLHFQYLCAFDVPGDYDYFQITAGPQTLGNRYRGRPPSKSRIDVTASKYTSMKAQ